MVEPKHGGVSNGSGGESTTLRYQFPVTLPETNSKIAPENGWLEDFLVSFWDRPIFIWQTVRFGEGLYLWKKAAPP